MNSYATLHDHEFICYISCLMNPNRNSLCEKYIEIIYEIRGVQDSRWTLNFKYRQKRKNPKISDAHVV